MFFVSLWFNAVTTNPQMYEEEPSERAVRRLMDQYTEIARLARALAHEIKNPLSTIRLNMELLAEDLEGLESPAARRASKRVGTVQLECRRLQQLLDDFLQFARSRRVELSPSDLNAELEDLLTFFKPQADGAGVEIIRYLDPELPTVMLDREAFRGALLNLLINAQQAMPDGGQLVVRTSAKGGRVSLELIDTGCGMSDHTASRMFEAFFSTKPGGSGLGLPTTAKIVEAHDGRITVQSDVGHGTHFTIDLPVPARLSAEPAEVRGQRSEVGVGITKPE